MVISDLKESFMFKILVFFVTVITLVSSCYADDAVRIPTKKLKASQEVIKPETVEYDSTTGYDFTGKGKLRYYDPMYYNYYLEDPKYNLFQNYPTFFMPAVKGKGR